MEITLFGASGKTGQILIQQALELGHKVKAYVRRKEAIQITHNNLKVIEAQLSDKEAIKQAISGSDLCISTLGCGSLRKRNPEVCKGIENIVEAMKSEGVSKIIYMSSLGANESKVYMPQPIRFIVCDLVLRVPLADHNQNETFIRNSGIKYTLVRPGGLTDVPLTGVYKASDETINIKGKTQISRANVAHFILKEAEENNYENKAVWMFE